ncbi:hypothetical protein [Sphingomonas asaccharolytica]|uniref:hypothetical protein n=1 Tax=Sphingomonas asaccharolytica TaxID=40681 RepID=UPI0012EEC3B4|nr:hypothetical protein [Sphingomonas asaccharolytica]
MRAIILLLMLAACSQTEPKKATDDYSAQINQAAAKRDAQAKIKADLQSSLADAKAHKPQGQANEAGDLNRRVTDLERARIGDDLHRRATFSEPSR